MQAVKLPRTLPVVLSPEEVSRLLAASSNIKHQVALAGVTRAARSATINWACSRPAFAACAKPLRPTAKLLRHYLRDRAVP